MYLIVITKPETPMVIHTYYRLVETDMATNDFKSTNDRKEYQRIYRQEHLNERKRYDRIYYQEHSDEIKEYQRIYNEEHPEKVKESRKNYLQILRYNGVRVLTNGTNKCSICGESRIDGLTIDHIGGGGSKHKKEIGNIYLWLKKNCYPTDEFQVLCMNCQMEKKITNNECHANGNLTPKQLKKRDYMYYWVNKLRWETLSAYSNSPIPYCKVCHTTNMWHLCLDHVNGNGAEDRRKYNYFGYGLYSKLRQLGYPDKDKYQVLCYTCNQIKKIQNDENVGRKTHD